MQKHVVTVIIALTVIAPTLFGQVAGETQASPRGESALLISASGPDEYAYISRAIPSVTVNQNIIKFQALVKVLSSQSYPAGILLQIDLRGYRDYVQNHELRYSFRLANDGSVLFYYPFMDSSAAVTRKEGWVPGKWCLLATVVHGNSAEFYIDGEPVGENGPEYPARSEGFTLSYIGIGKTDRQKLSVEAFVTDIQLIENGSVRLSEDFREDLRVYETRKSPSSLLQVTDASRYTSLDIHATPKAASAGEKVLLNVELLDGSLKGVGGRLVSFEYRSGNEWLKLTEARTFDNGTAESFLEVPSGFRGELLVRAHFLGDDLYSEATSMTVSVTVTPTAAARLDVATMVFSLYGLALATTVFLGFRFGHVRVLRGLIPILCSLTLFFSLPALTSSVAIESYVGYAPRVVRLQVFGPRIDELIWLLATVTLAVAWVALQNRKLLERHVTLLPIFFMFTSLSLHLSGREFSGAFLGMLSAIVTAFFPLLYRDGGFVMKQKESALGFITSLLTIAFVIEVGSAAGWLFNILNPHAPFDGEPRWIIPSLETDVFGLLYPLTLPALVVLMFSWLWVPCLKSLTKAINKKIGRLSGEAQSGKIAFLGHEGVREKGLDPTSNNGIRNRCLGKSRYVAYITIPAIIGCSLLLVYYPYFYSARLIGVDTPWYYQNLLDISGPSGFSHVMSNYGASSRMPYLLILYVIMALTSFTPEFVVKIGPAVPAAFLGVATFFLMRSITRDDVLASLSAFLALFSITTTVGVYAGIFANWLALGWVVLFLGLLLRMWHKPSWPNILLSTLVSFAILLTHAWTWAVTLASLMVFVMLSLFLSLATHGTSPRGPAIKSSLLVVGMNLMILLLAASLFLTGEFIHLSSEGIAAISLNNFTSFPSAVAFTARYYVGGFIANPPIILIAIIGLVFSRRFGQHVSLLLSSILLVTSTPLLFVGSWWQWRLLYMVPYQLPAVFGVAMASQGITRSNGRLAGLCRLLFMLVVLLASLCYSLRCLNYVPS